MDKPVIELLPDYGGGFLWWRSGPQRGPVRPDVLHLSAALIADLASWMDDWLFDATGDDDDALVARGPRLAARIASELGNQVDVVYEETP